MDPAFVSESFAAISVRRQWGYRPLLRSRATTKAMIAPNMLYLLDSGGQYLHGTTDVTRTVRLVSPPLSSDATSPWCCAAISPWHPVNFLWEPAVPSWMR
jgi:hypothetical protein